MESWTPWQVFVFSGLSAICGAMAVLFRQSSKAPQENPITLSVILSAVIEAGGLGSFVGVLGYVYVAEFRRVPWLSVGAGFLVGMGLIKPTLIRDLVLRVFNVPSNKNMD